MYEELKTKYPYITEEQWGKVEMLEAEYVDFLSEEDMKAHQDAILASEETKRAKQIQAIIDGLNIAEGSPQAQLIIGGTFALQDFFFSQTGRYIGQDVMHQFIQYPEFRGLRVYVNSYTDADGVSNPGFNIVLKFTHESGLNFTKTVPGKGNNPQSNPWSLIELI